ncbi:hypothetical protein Mapa_006335 [Marchantia paleacea]|nr:hypothetical protein Mapa_006335 [Marchantia paleacea]
MAFIFHTRLLSNSLLPNMNSVLVDCEGCHRIWTLYLETLERSGDQFTRDLSTGTIRALFVAIYNESPNTQ